MEDIKLLRNDDEYNEALARLQIGAKYISGNDFQKLPKKKQEAAMRRYNQLTFQILRYKGLV